MMGKTKVSDEEILSLQRSVDIEYARQDFLEYVMEVKPDYKVEWFNQIICDRLTKLYHEEGKRIMIWVPPQHGKSELVSRLFPSWVLGKNPKAKIIQSSYGQDLATGFCRSVQATMELDNYARIFPDSTLNARNLVTTTKGAKRTGNFFETVGHGGYMYSVGVGGPTTGKTANPFFIIDDPIKDMQQADSTTYQDYLIDWFESVAETRCSPKTNIILMHTRWHKNDLCGQLLEKNPGEWEILCLPALAYPDNHKYKHPKDKRNEGETIWPDFRHTQEQMEAMKQRISPRVWASLWQQSPIIKGGNLIKEAWLKYYDNLPIHGEKRERPHGITSWDLTFKAKSKSKNGKVDYVAGAAIYKIGADFFIDDIYCERINFSGSLEAVVSMKNKHPKITGHLVEDKANGTALMDMLSKHVSGLVPCEPVGSKEERLQACLSFFIAGNVHINKNISRKLLGMLIEQLTDFPNGAHDDLVDAISQGLIYLHRNTSAVDKLKALSRWN